MCGIAGLFNPDPAYPVNRQLLERMAGILDHRGPDEDGFFTGDGIGLGHRRLSIIDLAGGTQPISNEQGDIQVIFNGEIFNYRELMQELVNKGHRFRTRSDTEVIVHAYEQYGTDFVNHFNGQFAIAIWDAPHRLLILARDRVGIRPLYYTQLDDRTLLFASEMKSLFRHPDVHPRLDPAGLDQLFTMWVTIPPRTVFDTIRELAPGCILIASARGCTTRQYWRPTFPERNDYQRRPLNWYREELRGLLHDAVSLRLRADVPVAAYLSGGLDSSIITALVKKYHDNDLMTFSVMFRDAGFDERTYQNAMVQHLGTDHRSVEVGDNEIGDLFSDVVWHAESPMIRTAPAPLFALSRLVHHSNIKVVLTGEGADEVFGGYNIFKENRVRRFWARMPQSRLRPLLLLKLYPYIRNKAGTENFWQLFFKNHLTETSSPFYSHLIRWANTSRIKRFFSRDYQQTFNEQEHIFDELQRYIDPDLPRWDPLCQAQYLEMKLFMSGYLLSSQGDRMMMGHSVEGRFPFLDYRVIEFAGSVPPEYKLNCLNEKYLLKKTFDDLVPMDIINRPKQPYRAPIAHCFIGRRSLASQMLTTHALKQSGIFNPAAVELLRTKLEAPGVTAGATDDMAIAAITSTQLVYHHFVHELNGASEEKDRAIQNEGAVSGSTA